MRIDLVTTELRIGGAERCLTELAIGLQQRGDQVRVGVMGSLPTGARGSLVQRLQSAGITVDSAQCDSSRQFYRGYRWLVRWFRADRPDVLQTMLFHANVLATLAARRAAVPICVGGIRVAEPNRLRLPIERFATRRMDAIVSVSQSVKSFADTVFPPPTPPSIVIGNAVDLERIDHAPVASWEEFGWPQDAAVLLFVGRLYPQKGLDDLHTAIRPLLQSDDFSPQRPLRCLLVGDGPLRQQWTDIAAQIVPQQLQVVGWRPDVLSLMKACRLLVLPSHYEGMPNVVLEAMAVGKPIAATAVEGVAELLGEGAAMQTCPPRQPDQLRQLIQRLWTDDIQADCYGAANRRRVEREFQLTTMVDRYRQLYLRLNSSK